MIISKPICSKKASIAEEWLDFTLQSLERSNDFRNQLWQPWEHFFIHSRLDGNGKAISVWANLDTNAPLLQFDSTILSSTDPADRVLGPASGSAR